ncbi:iron chelate uptake ABC transporter family permease subunit [uncultured Ilyobacter sp.]|uniref:FecCD family ABC transporter permease n=1 Tax=uncultured Ilyobacter sp. TaxID=544433 RepID=UPI0029C80FEF|nr:iron chelate uptake ABC transporter family permease subunit [uncultured Ilyobacter sp.]
MIKTRITKKTDKIFISLFLFLLSAFVIATALGSVNVPLIETSKIILKSSGLIGGLKVDDSFQSIIFHIRLPRIVVAAMVGGSLAVSGAVMQGMFRNPMADPGILGISSGASLGAVLAVGLGLTSQSMYYMPLCASLGSMIAAFIIYLLASKDGKMPVLTLILAGVAVSTFIGAVTSLILTSMGEYQVKEYLFWSVGGLSGRRWEHVELAFVPIIICISILLTFARELNIMILGEEEAYSVGLNPSKTRKKVLFFVSITTGMAVCISGTISFVGLVVPHIMRLIVGPDHRVLMPASVLAGSVFVVLCDLVARTVIIPAEIGVGIVTSLLGAPYFIYLLNKSRKEGVML